MSYNLYDQSLLRTIKIEPITSTTIGVSEKKNKKNVGALQSGCRFIRLARTISTLCDLFDFPNSL